MDGYRRLDKGQVVEFAVEDGPKGVHAKDIQAWEAPQLRAVG